MEFANVGAGTTTRYYHDGDGDGDGDIDDYLSYELCLTAPPDEPPDAVCLAFHDFDVAGESDGRVDLDDFGGLLNCFRGSGQPPPPECFRPAPAGEVPGSGSFALHGSMVDVLSGGRGPGDELALQYSRARYFDLKHGRFLQRDPKGYIDGANLYEAFASNPARFTDPMGTQYEDDGLLAAIRRYLTGDGWMEQVSDRMGITTDPNPMRQLVYEQVDQRLIYPLAETANRAEPVVTRVAGGMRAAEGGVELVVAVVYIADTGSVGAWVGGSALGLHGIDSLQAGTRQMVWGEVTPTETYSLIADAGYPTLAFAVDTVPSVVAAVGAPALALERASAAPALTVSHVVGESTRPVSLSSRVFAAAERGYQRVVVVMFDAEPGDYILGSGLSPGEVSATQRPQQMVFAFMEQTSGGSIAYGELDALGRPSGVHAVLTQEMMGTGTRASSALFPPGFVPGGRFARGHLLARQLGGSGTDARNLITVVQNPANTPVMRSFENQIRAAVEGGQMITLEVVPVYDGSEPICRGITIIGRGDKDFDLGVTVLNPSQ